MRDLQDQFRDLDALDAPDQWASIEARAMVEGAATGRARRLYTPPWEAALAAALAVA